MAMEDESRISKWKLALLIGVPVAVLGAYLGYVAYQRKRRRRTVTRQEQRKPPVIEHVDPEKSSQPDQHVVTPEEEPKPKSLLEQAKEAKARGNEFFKQKNKEAAISCYEEAVQLCPEENTGDLAICYHNIAACLESMAKSEEDETKKSSLFEHVVEKCTTSLLFNPRYVKPMQRRMRAYQALGRRRESFMDANRLTILDKSNNPISDVPADLLNELGMELAREAFPNLEPQCPPKQLVLGHFVEYAWKDDLSMKRLRELWRSAHEPQPEASKPEEENQSNKDEGDEEVVENGTENDDETGQLSDDSENFTDAPSPSKVAPKDNVLSSEETDARFSVEPFVKAATMYSQNNFDTILGELTAAVEEGHPIFRPHALLLRGSFRFLWRIYKGALDDLQCVADTPGLPVEMLADAHVKRAGILSIMSERELSDKELQLATKLNKDQADVYITRAKTNVESDNPEVLLGAQEDLRRALSLAPNAPLINYYLGLVIHRMAMLYQNLQFAQNMQPGLNPQMMQMSEAMQLSKHATEAFENGYRKFPTCSEGLIIYAMFLQDLQEVERSEELVHQAIQLEPENGLAHVILSTVYLARQEPEKALKCLEAAVTVDGSCIQAFELLASLEMQKGNQERALELHDMAIKNSRSFQEMQQVLMTKEVIIAQRRACHEYGINPVSLFEQRMSQLQASGQF